MKNARGPQGGGSTSRMPPRCTALHKRTWSGPPRMESSPQCSFRNTPQADFPRLWAASQFSPTPAGPHSLGELPSHWGLANPDVMCTGMVPPDSKWCPSVEPDILPLLWSFAFCETVRGSIGKEFRMVLPHLLTYLVMSWRLRKERQRGSDLVR